MTAADYITFGATILLVGLALYFFQKGEKSE